MPAMYFSTSCLRARSIDTAYEGWELYREVIDNTDKGEHIGKAMIGVGR